LGIFVTFFANTLVKLVSKHISKEKNLGEGKTIPAQVEALEGLNDGMR
jgi:hypothetical protein